MSTEKDTYAIAAAVGNASDSTKSNKAEKEPGLAQEKKSEGNETSTATPMQYATRGKILTEQERAMQEAKEKDTDTTTAAAVGHTSDSTKSKVEKEPGLAQEKKSKGNETSTATPMRYATRGKILTEQERAVQEAKDKILGLDIVKKRKLYKCQKNFTELKDIPTWPEYFSDVVDTGESKRKSKSSKKKVVSDVNSDLNAKISVFRGDITTLEIDAIVNAANESLLGGGGVDGAIHRAAGKDLLLECELLNGCSAGDAKMTCGYRLPSKHVIHTVGPRGENPESLASCYRKSLNLMRDNDLTTVAFPCISTGIFGYPNENAAKVVLNTIRHWLDTEEYAENIQRIIFCLFLPKDVDIYNEELQLFFPLEKE